MGISGVVSSAWWAILLFIGVVIYIFRRIYKGEKGKRYFDAVVLKLPIVKSLILGTFKIRFSYTMNLMLANGVGIIEALENTEGIFRNSIFKDLINNAMTRVKKGEKLSRALSAGIMTRTGIGSLFNSSLLGMIHAGEAGDRVAEVMDKIGYNAEIEVEEKIKTLTSLLEPIIIMVIGIFIGFVVLAIMLPIFQINQMFG